MFVSNVNGRKDIHHKPDPKRDLDPVPKPQLDTIAQKPSDIEAAEVDAKQQPRRKSGLAG
jgi:hypothetical protein